MPTPDFSNIQSGSNSTAPSTPSVENNANGGRTYVVTKGDSLSAIAKREYGDMKEWRRIYDANRDIIKDPDLISPGQTLRLP
jgi:nucleoid-associated protein YgaU